METNIQNKLTVSADTNSLISNFAWYGDILCITNQYSICSAAVQNCMHSLPYCLTRIKYFWLKINWFQHHVELIQYVKLEWGFSYCVTKSWGHALLQNSPLVLGNSLILFQADDTKSLSVSFNWPGGVLHFVVIDGCGQCCPLPLHPQFGPNICVSQQLS